MTNSLTFYHSTLPRPHSLTDSLNHTLTNWHTNLHTGCVTFCITSLTLHLYESMNPHYYRVLSCWMYMSEKVSGMFERCLRMLTAAPRVCCSLTNLTPWHRQGSTLLDTIISCGAGFYCIYCARLCRFKCSQFYCKI